MEIRRILKEIRQISAYTKHPTGDYTELAKV